VGIVLLAVGMTAAFVAPLEFYCFYLFSSGGRFEMEGFRFGSLMYANIACQIIAYYLIAGMCIPLGYGHLRLRRWARTLSQVGLWAWLIFGVPALAGFLAVLAQSKKPGLATMVAAGLLAVVCYPALPVVLLRLYRGRNVRLTFEHHDRRTYWTDRLPLPALLLCFVLALYAVLHHVPVLFNGLYPLPGALLADLPGFILVDVSILCLVGLIWGAARLRAWAWWGSLAYFGLLTLSLMTALFGFDVVDVLERMTFAPIEVEAMQGTPLRLYYLTPFVALPLAGTFVLLLYARRDFGIGSNAT
jgi:hypothetical protein